MSYERFVLANLQKTHGSAKAERYFIVCVGEDSLSSDGDGFGKEEPAKESSFCNRVNADVLQKE